jgi:hypothetical protein
MNTQITEVLVKADEALNKINLLQNQLSMLSAENVQLLGEVETLKTKVSILENK